MKTCLPLLCAILLGAGSVRAQVSNLTVNGSTSNFTMTSGDVVHWEYDVDTGATTNLVFWFDLNHNGTVDPASDQIFASFSQTDGQQGGNGPGDGDGLANGHVMFQAPVGLAPGDYVMTFTENSVTAVIAGTVLPLASPSFTVSGHVTPPPGKSAKNIFVEMEKEGNGGDKPFWDALTDSTGEYTVALHEDSAVSNWHLRVRTQFPPSVVSPQDTNIVLSGNVTGIDFVFSGAAAQVTGYLKDELGDPVVGGKVEIHSTNGPFWRQSDVGPDGFFQIGIMTNELSAGPFRIDAQTGDMVTTTVMRATREIGNLSFAESLYVPLTQYSANSQITGTVTLNGGPPNWPIQVMAQSLDTAEAVTYADSATGNFTLMVSDKLSSYEVFAANLFGPYHITSVIATPGQTGVIVAITVDGVSEGAGTRPREFSLSQNYPNPFNPVTHFQFSVATAQFVTLKVYDVLGKRVATLVNETKQPGMYTVEWDASPMPSGIYYYRMQAGTFVQTRKLVLMR